LDKRPFAIALAATSGVMIIGIIAFYLYHVAVATHVRVLFINRYLWCGCSKDAEQSPDMPVPTIAIFCFMPRPLQHIAADCIWTIAKVAI
jgi:hypothetical protein